MTRNTAAILSRLPVALFCCLLFPVIAQEPIISRLELAFTKGDADSVIVELQGLHRAPGASIDVHFEACMLMAECYYQRYSMEYFAAWNDSAAALIVGNDEQRWARVEVNRCRYANFFVKPDQALIRGEAALARYRRAPDRATWKHAYQIYQALGTTHRNIHQGTDVLFALFDTAQTLLAQQPDVIQYWHASLHKAISNSALDRVMSGLYDPEPYVPLCNHHQLTTLRILDEHYPKQLVDRCTLQNLRGLYYVYLHQPDSALWWLKRTEALIGTKSVTEWSDDLATAWFSCLRYRSFIYDQAPWCNDIPILQTFLGKLTASQQHFTAYKAGRATAGGLFFDDTYWLSPFATIMATCTQLWELTGDTSYIEQALWATEKIRRDTWNTSQTIRGNEGRILADPPANMLQVLRKRLAPDEAVLICAHSSLGGIKESVFVLVVTPSAVALRSCVPGFSLRNRSQMEDKDPASYRFVYHALYNAIYRPVEPILGSTARLRVFPSGDMAFVSLDALLADTAAKDIRACGPLVQRHAFSYPLLLIPPEEATGPTKGQALYIAPTPGNGQLTDLKRMRSAMRQWATHATFDSSIVQNDLGRDLTFAKEIYLAGHCAGGYHQDHQPRHYFSTDTTGSWIVPSDLLGLDLHADLVVHLACKSGVFDADRNGSAISFSRAFLMAGARNVVSSQYLADEASSIQLIGLFRDELANGLPNDVALQRAKLAYLSQCRTPEEQMPIHWAGWQVLGDPDPVEKNDRWAWEWLLAALLIGIGGLAWHIRRH